MGSQAMLQREKPLEAMLEHEIRIRAYDLYEQRGRQPGHSVDDWLAAEAEVRERCDSAKATVERKIWLSET